MPTESLTKKPGAVIGIALVITALLAIPFLAMEPDSQASQEPGGEIFDARDEIEDRFASDIIDTLVIVEAREGDLLLAEPLRELADNTSALRDDPALGQGLFEFYDADDATTVVGVRTIADMIDDRLPGGLGSATDQQVKEVAGELIAERGTRDLGLSVRSLETSAGWVVPAVLVPVLSDNSVVGFGQVSVRLGTDTESEKYARSLVDAIRGERRTIDAWGVAIDVNLTSEEQGAAAGPFIGFAIVGVLAVVGLTFRSYWVVAVVGASLSALIIWLQGITNLIGLKDDLILSLIVPIAMISFGVDFAFHSVGRYREERRAGKGPRGALLIGLPAVMGAMILALASDAVAFLANISAGIESIVQFGIGAAIALAAAFFLLGIVTPIAVAGIEERLGDPIGTRRTSVMAVAGSIGAAMLAMASVLLGVFVFPAGGVALLALYLLVQLLIPFLVAARRPRDAAKVPRTERNRLADFVASGVALAARRRRVVVSTALLVAAGAAVLAVQVPTAFDVKDFFAADTDFVTSLDKLDEHVGDRAGESALIYVKAPLDQTATIVALSTFRDDVRHLDGDSFSRDADGLVEIDGGVLELIDDVVSTPVAIAVVTDATGVELADSDRDGLPDDSEQLRAVYNFTRQAGVPVDANNLLHTPDAVRGILFVEGDEMATLLEVQIPGSREVENIAASRADLRPLIDDLQDNLRSLDPTASVVLTGDPILRQESLDAVSRALQISLPIAVVLCLAVAWIFMRTLRFALVSIVPILLVVAWLYAFMYLFGFSINLVTATIGAVSIGIGIDFAIHFTVRYREELVDAIDPVTAAEAAGRGTGAALVASALSSIVGFAMLALAPMPLFASYGLLTAVMIAMSAAASLVVLPALLVMITTNPSPVEVR